MASSGAKSNGKSDDLQKEFRLFDTNKDGFIDKDELKIILQKILPNYSVPDEEIQRMISNVDTNNDGKIDYKEFIESIYPQLPPRTA